MHTPSEISVILEQETAGLKELGGLLLDERKSLATNDAEGIQRIADEKRLVAEKLDRLAGTRRQVLSKLGFEGASAIDNLVAHYEKQKITNNVAHGWTALRQELQTCREANCVNGAIVASAERGVQQMLALLRGQQPGQELYGKHGRRLAEETPQRITVA